ncbi:MAG: glycosyltransferase family 2 protein [Lachnospiraceae bacterium]|nr:glycosyltransferase family 2 protein [Lachnospiraceae bacterium]
MVSILLPTYNRANVIKTSIESVLAQTYQDFELIIIDDGSQDDTKTALRHYLENPKIIYTYRENGGCQAARNTGSRLAKGEWLAFADSDDLWEKDKLEKQMAYIVAHPDKALVSCAYDLTSPNGIVLRIPPNPEQGGPSNPESFLPGMLLQNWVGSPTILVKRELYLALEGLNQDYPALDDWELSLRLLKKGFSLGFVNEILVHAFVSEEGMSGNAAAYYDARCRLLADYKDLYESCGVFEKACQDILKRAENDGILNPVKKIMMLRLSH